MSELVVGVDVILADDEFVAFSDKKDVQRILEKIQTIDFEMHHKDFSPNVLKRAEIYPNIWNEEDKDSLFEEIKTTFEELRDFYKRNSHLNIITSIY